MARHNRTSAKKGPKGRRAAQARAASKAPPRPITAPQVPARKTLITGFGGPHGPAGAVPAVRTESLTSSTANYDPTVALAFTSPADNSQLVGAGPGVVVTIVTTMTVSGLSNIGTYTFGTTAVTVQFGSTDQPRAATLTSGSLDPLSGGTLTFSYIGPLPSGGASIEVLVKGTLIWSDEYSQGDSTGGAIYTNATITLQPSVVTLTITFPQDGQIFVGSTSGIPITATGSAASQLELDRLTWSIDGSASTTLNIFPFVGPWSVPMTVPLGTHTLTFTAYDVGAHSQTQTIFVHVTLPGDIFGTDALSYLRALVEFATEPFNGTTARATTDTTQQQNVTLDMIDQNFHQSIALLLDSANQVKANESVNPARICIEVLRKYVAANPPSNSQTQRLQSEEARYLAAVYRLLLNKIGTSYDDIRIARTYDRNQPDDVKKLQLITDYLEIQLGGNRPDQLDQMFFDVGAATGATGALSENAIENLFGLVDSTRDPFSQGATLGDTKGLITRWNLQGTVWNQNTDSNGLIYVSFQQLHFLSHVVVLYKDAARQSPIAEGQIVNGRVVLRPLNNSGVSGWMVCGTSNTLYNAALSVYPRLLSWQHSKLRADWTLESSQLAQAFVVDDTMQQILQWSLSGVTLPFNNDGNGYVYLTLTAIPGPAYKVSVYSDQARTVLIASGTSTTPKAIISLTPANASGVTGSITLGYKADSNTIALVLVPAYPLAVDPDLLSDADFTAPDNAAHKLYITRQQLVATWLGQLKTQREAAANPITGMSTILSAILQDPQYYPAGMKIADVLALGALRASGTDISAPLRALSLDSAAFDRLVRLCTLVNAGVQPLDLEWDEIYSILVQVQKNRTTFAWVAEEQKLEILVSPDFFTYPALLPPLFATGLDANGQTLDDGSVDPHWSIISGPQGVGSAYATISASSAWPIGQAWLRNSDVSRWISPTADEGTGDLPGLYTYRTSFNLGNYDPSSVWLVLRVAADDGLAGLSLNGTDLGLSASGFTGFTNLEVTGPFQAGINTLEFTVKNGGSSLNPSGLRVELSFGAPPEMTLLPDWRASSEARRAWDVLLQGRINEDASLQSDLQSEVNEAEKQTLPMLKDALSAAGCVKSNVVSLNSTGRHFTHVQNGYRDIDWAITGVHAHQSDPAYLPSPPNSHWKPNNNLSRWISPSPRENSGLGDPAGTYTFHTTFDLVGVDLTGVDAEFDVLVDNKVTDVLLNNHSSGWTWNSATASKRLSLASGFVAGTNTLDFVVQNTSIGPCGFRVAVAATAKTFVDADWLASALLIDIKSTGDAPTTRQDKATELMQALFVALRNYELEQLSPRPPVAGWVLTETPQLFDEEWDTMGTFAGWNAAMLAFLYMESLLFPNLRSVATGTGGEPQAVWEKTREFDKFASQLRAAAPLAPDQAVSLANDYLVALNAKDGNNNPIYPDLPAELRVTVPLPAGGGFADPRGVDVNALVSSTTAVMNGYVQSQNWIAVAFLWEAWYSVAVQIALELQKAQQFDAALAWFGILYAYYRPLAQNGTTWTDDQRKIFPGLRYEATQNLYLQVPTWTVTTSNPHVIAGSRAFPYARFLNLSIIDCILDYADAEFTVGNAESIANARNLYVYSLELLSQLEAVWPADPVLRPNPRLAALGNHAENNLEKLRKGRNIAGLLLPTDGTSGAASSTQPSAYRYSTLVERAKQIVALAQQIEGSYLAALAKGEDESYSALKANQDLETAKSAVKLEVLKQNQAADGVTMAQDQLSKAQGQVDYYSGLLNSGILDLEGIAAAMQASAAIADAVMENYAGAISSAGAALNSAASIEQKQMEWQGQMVLAGRDVIIGSDQVTIANDGLAIADQDLINASTQVDHASATVKFLATKFLNADLYQWMSGVLGSVYSYFLRQATATARLAESQLAFERQEPALNIIQADYWRPLTAPAGQATNGLTGAESLLADITQLDQYALDTDKLRLQMTKTISLAQLDPVSFQQFLESGIFRFTTPMVHFDEDFPGHYLRLIKQVRVSVVALIPPTQGIRATLGNTGISRVITVDNDGNFTPTIVRRDPQLIALSSPANATGMFDLTSQPAMLLPFEDLGVDTSWEYIMARAANPIDYTSVVDILLSIDYTALDSPDYRRQVLQGLDSSVSADRSYSFRQQFADAWYFLNNPDQSSTPMIVPFQTMRTDFPPNIEDDGLTIAQVLLYFVPADGASFEIEATLSLSGTDPVGNPKNASGHAVSVDQIISTRRGASSWLPMKGMSTTGNWNLDLSSPDMRAFFQNNQIKDILFVISYNGRVPDWPA